jgi:hypothetical protein
MKSKKRLVIRKNPEKIEPSWMGLSTLLGKEVTVRIQNKNRGIFSITSELKFINIPKPRFEIYYPNKEKILPKGYSAFLPSLVSAVTKSPSGTVINIKNSEIGTEYLREIYNYKHPPFPKGEIHLVINEDYFHSKGSSSSSTNGKLVFNKKENFYYMKIANSVFCAFEPHNIYKIHYNMVYVNI